MKFGNVEFESAQAQLDLNVLGRLNAQGALVVEGPSEFKGETIRPHQTLGQKSPLGYALEEGYLS